MRAGKVCDASSTMVYVQVVIVTFVYAHQSRFSSHPAIIRLDGALEGRLSEQTRNVKWRQKRLGSIVDGRESMNEERMMCFEGYSLYSLTLTGRGVSRVEGIAMPRLHGRGAG